MARTSAFHKAKQRRIERQQAHGHGRINLVPLIDILTSIVFFSLLTYTGAAMAALTQFDLVLPPVVITGESPTASAEDRERLTLLLAVRVRDDRTLQIEHSEEGGFRQVIRNYRDSTSLAQFESLMKQIRERYPQNADVTVVPDDAVLYDDVIHVLERLKRAEYTGIALASRARDEQRVALGGR